MVYTMTTDQGQVVDIMEKYPALAKSIVKAMLTGMKSKEPKAVEIIRDAKADIRMTYKTKDGSKESSI